MPSVQPWTGIYSERLYSNMNSPPFSVLVCGTWACSRKSGLCFELVAGMEARIWTGSVPYRLLLPPVMASPGGAGPRAQALCYVIFG